MTDAREPTYAPLSLVVGDVSNVSPHVRRIVLTGDQVGRLVIGGPDQSLKIFIPRHGRPPQPVNPSARTWMEAYKHVPDPADRPWARTYTVSRIGGDTFIEVTLHGLRGPGTEWAASVEPGAELVVLAPMIARNGGWKFEPPPEATQLVMSADQSAFPALKRILHSLPPEATGHVFLQAHSEQDKPVLEKPAGVGVTWVTRTEGRGAESALARALSGWVPEREGPVCAWIAGADDEVRAQRRYLVSHLGLAAEDVTFRPYWWPGATEDERRARNDAARGREQAHGVTTMPAKVTPGHAPRQGRKGNSAASAPMPGATSAPERRLEL